MLLVLLLLSVVSAKNVTIEMYTTLDDVINRDTFREIKNFIDMSYFHYPLEQPLSPANVLIVRDAYHWITTCYFNGYKIKSGLVRKKELEFYEKDLFATFSGIYHNNKCSWVEFKVQAKNLVVLPKTSKIKRICCIN